MGTKKDLKKLRKVVNEYLLAQNSTGHPTGIDNRDERCQSARTRLCGTVYQINVKAAKSQ